jgi:hypothetical protein
MTLRRSDANRPDATRPDLCGRLEVFVDDVEE